MTKGLIAGIDIGGTSIKTMIIDGNFNLKAFSKVPTEKAYKIVNGQRYVTGPQRGLDADMLWNLVKASLSNALLQVCEKGPLLSIAVSTFGCTVLMLDEKDRQIDMYVDDSLIEEEITYYRGLFSEEEFFSVTGYPLEKGTVLFNLSAFGHDCKNPRPAKIMSADDYIIYKFSGEFVRDRSLAYSCGAWDWKNNCWLDSFIIRSGIPIEALGNPIDSGTPVGEMKQELLMEFGLLSPPVITVGGHDYEAAAFAVHPFVENGVMNITGTVDLIAYFDFDSSDHRSEPYRMMRDAHVIKGMNSHMVETLGAVQTEWLKSITVAENEKFSWDDFFAEMAKTVGKGKSELFIPKVFGSSFPKMAVEEKGAYLGLCRTTERGDLLRAMCEGMCFQTKLMLEKLFQDSTGFQHIVLLGGASRNEVWTQLKCDILGLPILVPEQSEASAFGAALLASVGCGLCSIEECIERISKQSLRRYYPNKTRNRYYENFYRKIWLPADKFCRENDSLFTSFIQENGGVSDE